MAPLFVPLSIFIKGLPLVYPGRGLMAGGVGGEVPVLGDHAVTFTVSKEGLLLAPFPKVLLLKTFWRTPLTGPLSLWRRGAVKC